MAVATISGGAREIPRHIPIETVAAALSKLPPDYLFEVMQFIEFLEYKSSAKSSDIADDLALWAAVEANQAYKREHPDEENEKYESGDDFLKAFADL